MAEPTVIRFSRRCNVRGLTFIGGKQCACTCPHGQYVVHGEELLSYSDLGKPAQALAVRIEHVDRREIWFVAPAVVKAAINDTPTGASMTSDEDYEDTCICDDCRLLQDMRDLEAFGDKLLCPECHDKAWKAAKDANRTP
jgi:hypothetical protein